MSQNFGSPAMVELMWSTTAIPYKPSENVICAPNNVMICTAKPITSVAIRVDLNGVEGRNGSHFKCLSDPVRTCRLRFLSCPPQRRVAESNGWGDNNVTGANNRNELISGNPVRRLCGIYRLLVIKRILGRITGHEYSIYFQSLGFTKNFIQNLYSIFQTAPYSVLSHQPKFRYLRRAFTMASMSKFKIQGKELKTHSHSN